MGVKDEEEEVEEEEEEEEEDKDEVVGLVEDAAGLSPPSLGVCK